MPFFHPHTHSPLRTTTFPHFLDPSMAMCWAWSQLVGRYGCGDGFAERDDERNSGCWPRSCCSKGHKGTDRTEQIRSTTQWLMTDNEAFHWLITKWIFGIEWLPTLQYLHQPSDGLINIIKATMNFDFGSKGWWCPSARNLWETDEIIIQPYDVYLFCPAKQRDEGSTGGARKHQVRFFQCVYSQLFALHSRIF